jgi:hypothetical protein
MKQKQKFQHHCLNLEIHERQQKPVLIAEFNFIGLLKKVEK